MDRTKRKKELDLKIKIASALAHIRMALYYNFEYNLFLGHSGGKDSQVILHLAKQIMPNIILIHNIKPMLGTSNSPLTEMDPKTLEFLYTVVAKEEIIYFVPTDKMKSFLQQKQLFCQIDGSRISEADRNGKSSNFIKNRRNVNRKELRPYIQHGIFDLSICYPIYDWTNQDILDYIKLNNISISKEYSA
jgi:3'-phosphoadenosine 5'-phosphosulfate sulfotransferase (PAPS reductase)/FAD synthetase